jgi:hypothetical protein
MSRIEGYVWIVIASRGPLQERYVVGVHKHGAGAELHAARWAREHPRGTVDIERYTVLE